MCSRTCGSYHEAFRRREAHRISLRSEERSSNRKISKLIFFPSNAMWLPPGRSTAIQDCCKRDKLFNSHRGRCCSGRKSKLEEDRYIVQRLVTFQVSKTENQNRKTKNHSKTKTPNQKQTQTTNKNHTKEKKPQGHKTVT